MVIGTLLFLCHAAAEKINIPDVGNIEIPKIMEVKNLLENKGYGTLLTSMTK